MECIIEIIIHTLLDAVIGSPGAKTLVADHTNLVNLSPIGSQMESGSAQQDFRKLLSTVKLYITAESSQGRILNLTALHVSVRSHILRARTVNSSAAAAAGFARRLRNQMTYCVSHDLVT